MGKLADFFRRISKAAPFLRPSAHCTVCGVMAPVCCLKEGVPPRCDLHCNHLDNEGRSMR